MKDNDLPLLAHSTSTPPPLLCFCDEDSASTHRRSQKTTLAVLARPLSLLGAMSRRLCINKAGLTRTYTTLGFCITWSHDLGHELPAGLDSAIPIWYWTNLHISGPSILLHRILAVGDFSPTSLLVPMSLEVETKQSLYELGGKLRILTEQKDCEGWICVGRSSLVSSNRCGRLSCECLDVGWTPKMIESNGDLEQVCATENTLRSAPPQSGALTDPPPILLQFNGPSSVYHPHNPLDPPRERVIRITLVTKQCGDESNRNMVMVYSQPRNTCSILPMLVLVTCGTGDVCGSSVAW
ncbi:hypothetical protein Tco_1213784 [Tanacetum coccineum]